ncbi:Serine/threonine-protein phosphatase 6 regulatory subunit 3 [Linum grandiflorum]
MHSFRGQHMFEAPVTVSPETIDAMLPQLGDLLKLLNVSSDEKILPTTYGQLKPPLGKHRLKIVEFIAILLKTGNDTAQKELVSSGTIKRVLDLFFEYPYNNALHHQVESIIFSCLETKSEALIDHMFRECDLVGKLLQTDKNPTISGDENQPTLPAAGKRAPLLGNRGHITRICNKLCQLRNNNSCIHTYLQENSEWNDWQASVLQERNIVENVYRWACGRPTALLDRIRDSDEEDLHDRDYDVQALANNLNQAFGYKLYGNEGAEEENGGLDRDDEDVYFDNESAEIVISSLRLDDDQGSLFTNSNWFVFQEDRIGGAPASTSAMDAVEEMNLNIIHNDDQVVVGENDEVVGGTSTSNTDDFNGIPKNDPIADGPGEVVSFLKLESPENEENFGDRSLPEWMGWGASSDVQMGMYSLNPFLDHDPTNEEPTVPNGSSEPGSGISLPSQTGSGSHSLFEENVEFVGVEPEGTEKAMEQALKEGIVGEAGALKRTKLPEKENPDDLNVEFNDSNFWKVDREVAVLE